MVTQITQQSTIPAHTDFCPNSNSSSDITCSFCWNSHCSSNTLKLKLLQHQDQLWAFSKSPCNITVLPGGTVGAGADTSLLSLEEGGHTLDIFWSFCALQEYQAQLWYLLQTKLLEIRLNGSSPLPGYTAERRSSLDPATTESSVCHCLPAVCLSLAGHCLCC